MDRSVSAAEANRNFSSLLRSVGEGATVTITRHGRPVARMTPCVRDKASIVAAASAGCDLLLSEDMHDGMVWRGTTVRNPFAARFQLSNGA